MSDKQEESESLTLSDWTLVSSQGEIVSGDDQSDSSESSIEVVSLEDNEVVSCRFNRRSSSRLDDAAVAEETSNADQVCISSSTISDIASEPMRADPSQSTTEDIHPLEDVTPNRPAEDDEQHLIRFENNQVKETDNESVTTDFVEDSSVKNSSDSNQSPDVSSHDDGDPILNQTLELQTEQLGRCETLPPAGLSMQTSDYPLEDTSNPSTQEEAEEGACCLQLLATGDEKCSSPAPVSFKQAIVSQVTGDQSLGGSASNGKSGSDTDSDYVRLDSLDSDNVEISDENGEEGQERVSDQHMCASGSSIGPGFNFLRGQGNESNRESFERDFEEVEDVNGEDTESCAEDGVDDRIESDQSDSGSTAMQNDIGDLSLFADIGDLPLEAGNVRRNYIHRPNNHLSTVLNIVVVLAAILTMGISLGIIMATDLEIEEWQNAYEMQTKKVNELESRLQQLIKAHVSERERVYEQEQRTLLGAKRQEEMVKLSQSRADAYERAFYWLNAHAISEDEKSINSFKLISTAIRAFVLCEEMGTKEQNEDCILKLLPVAKMFSVESPFSELVDEADIAEPSTEDLVVDDFIYEPATSEAYQDEAEYQHHEQDCHFAEDGCAESNALGKDETVIQAQPIPFDIKQLQQSLTREQERALHWQQLYLAERRQREKERENEEWEDERERASVEKEKSVDQIECLKKLMSTNLTTLTQHVAKWNVSVFDDFANLSMLMSGVAQLQDSVVDTVHKVLKSAESMFDQMHQKQEQQWQSSSSSRAQLYDQISKFLDNFKSNSIPNKEVVITHVLNAFDGIRNGLEGLYSEANMDNLEGMVNKILLWTDEWVSKLKDEEKENESPSDQDETVEESEEHQSVFDSMKEDAPTDKDQFDSHSNRDGFQVSEDDFHSNNDAFQVHDDNFHSSYNGFQSDDDGFQSSNDGFTQKNQEGSDQGSWSNKIGKVLQKTGRSVRTVGKHIISSWRKLKTAWNTKKPKLYDFAKKFTNKVAGVSSKFTKMCAKLPEKILGTHDGESGLIDIHSKAVSKLRKCWEKSIVENPCELLGKFSYECNTDHAEVRNNVKLAFSSFRHLFKKMRKVKPSWKWTVKVAEDKLDKIEEFEHHWGRTRLLPKADLEWVKCQNKYWTSVFLLLQRPSTQPLPGNTCDKVQLQDYISEVAHTQFCNEDVDLDYHIDDVMDERFDDYDDGIVNNGENSDGIYFYRDGDGGKNDIYDSEEKEKLWDKEVKVNSSGIGEEKDSNWYLERARYRLQLRREKEKAAWIFDRAEDREKQRRKQQLDEDLDGASCWTSTKEHSDKVVKCRKNKKRQHPAANWKEENSVKRDGKKHKGKGKKDGSWFMKAADHREEIRKLHHQADWQFERAEARRKNLHNMNKKKFENRKKFREDDHFFKKKSHKKRGNRPHCTFCS